MDTSLDGNRFAIGIARGLLWRGLMLAPLIFLGVFYFYPLINIFVRSLAPEGRLDLTSFAQMVSSAYYRDILVFTVWQAGLSTLLTLALALPSSYVFTRYRFPGKSLLLSLSTLAFVLPTVVVAVAFRALVGPSGLINSTLMNIFGLSTPPVMLERTLAIILIVHVFYNYAVALRIITGFWMNQSPRIEEAARVLGASGWRLWWYVRLPILRPALLAAAVLIYIFTFTSFGVILILGGVRFATVEVAIFRQAASLGNLAMAAALSLVQISFMLLLMAVYTRLQRHTVVDLQGTSQIAQAPKNLREWILVITNTTVMCILLFAPLLTLVFSSLTAGGELTLRHYQNLATNPRESVLFVPPTQAIANSLIFAVMATVMSVALGLLTAYLLAQSRKSAARWLDPLFMMPLATSAVTLGFGFIISLDRPPLNLRTSPILIPIAHTLVALPFVVRSILPAIHSIAPGIRESANVLGASGWQVWRLIDLPLIARGLVVGATFAFTISMGEFGASLFIARPDTPTMPVIIYRLISQPGLANYGQALAMSVLLMVVCGISFFTIERLRQAGIGEF